MAANNNNEMPFTRVNYRYLLIGVGILILGYIFMSGGGSGDPNVFDESAIFSPMRITVAPIVVMVGYIFLIYAIMKRGER
ncbi:MAG: DUF3098 domain-containing protein [Flavobacteriales bacterium]|nr:DUF3098 domain-containing protein [Flavobacteriales bacterium]MCB9193996.1 DUF3098 domain-containing protein [Flavobacteriales bacterium]